MKFIDIHTHLAWDVDDGIESLEECKKALQKAKEQNIDTIVATPHLCCGKDDSEKIVLLKERMTELKKVAGEFEINVVNGCELMLNEETKKTIKGELFIPIEGTKYVLCEDDVRRRNNDFVEYFDIYLKQMINAGYRPIVAHVERYFHEDIDLDYIAYLVELGCVIQVNTTSLLHENSVQYKNAMALLEKRMVHVIASDTHQAEGWRVPNLKDCYQKLIDEGFYEDYVRVLMESNPRHIVSGEEVESFSLKKVKKGMLDRIFGR